ncbi:LPS assembly protein LptD [Escherichia coli]
MAFQCRLHQSQQSGLLNDFDSKYGSSTDGYATQKLSVGYAVQNFNAAVQNSSRSSTAATVIPIRLSRSWISTPTRTDVGPFDTHLYAQAVKFTNSNSTMPEATRLHLEPTSLSVCRWATAGVASIPKRSCWQRTITRAISTTTTDSSNANTLATRSTAPAAAES